jgi:limonene 1,2-monooxygenase
MAPRGMKFGIFLAPFHRVGENPTLAIDRDMELIDRLSDLSRGGLGGLLFRAPEWASREQTLRSYELSARYVMPRFQGSLDTVAGSSEWARANRKTIFGPSVEAIRKAYADAGRPLPKEFMVRTSGAADAPPTVPGGA